MSGGRFNYTQYHIDDIANYIQEELDNFKNKVAD